MTKMFTLLRSQRSRVFEMLREAGLEPAEFSWAKGEIAGDIVVSRLNHRDRMHYFQFSSYEPNAGCIACPGRYRLIDYEYPKNWQEQEEVFRNWACFLKREMETPDPWAALAKYTLAVDSHVPDNVANEPIPACEADEIGRALTRLGERIGRELKLDGASLALVQAKLAYLAEAARRQRSRDWMYTALGACATAAMSLSLSRDGAVTIWHLLQDEVGRIVHLT